MRAGFSEDRVWYAVIIKDTTVLMRHYSGKNENNTNGKNIRIIWSTRIPSPSFSKLPCFCLLCEVVLFIRIYSYYLSMPILVLACGLSYLSCLFFLLVSAPLKVAWFYFEVVCLLTFPGFISLHFWAALQPTDFWVSALPARKCLRQQFLGIQISGAKGDIILGSYQIWMTAGLLKSLSSKLKMCTMQQK